MKQFLSLALLLCILGTSGCQTFDGLREDIGNIDFSGFTTASSTDKDRSQSDFLIDGDCPKVEIVGELGMISEFQNRNSSTPDWLISAAHIAETQSTCTHAERSVTVDLKVVFEGAIGPQGRAQENGAPFFTYPYFIAVTSSSGKILAKEVFSASMTYEAGQDTRKYTDTLRQIIPADSRAAAGQYKILIGFQLREDQLSYNRDVLERERLEQERLERERIEAEKAAAEQAKKEAVMSKEEAMQAKKQAEPQKIIIQKTPNYNTGRAGPIDINTP